MKKQPITTLLLLLVLCMSILSVSAVFAQGNGTNTEQFSNRCTRAQRNLSGPVRDQDIRTRVNRLQAYRYIAKRLDVFTQRLENNNQPDAAELRAQVTQLDKDIDTFASSYESYDGMRDSLAEMPDCGKSEDLFQTRLSDVRQARATVNQNVLTLNTALDTTIRNQLSDLALKLESGQQ